MVLDRRAVVELTDGHRTMSVGVDERAGRQVLCVSGEIDVANSEALLDAICTQVQEARAVTVDLGSVTFIVSSGLSALSEAHRRYRADGVELSFIAGNPKVRKLLDITGLDRVLYLEDV